MKTLVQISAERQRKTEHQRQIFCEYLYYQLYMYQLSIISFIIKHPDDRF